PSLNPSGAFPMRQVKVYTETYIPPSENDRDIDENDFQTDGPETIDIVPDEYDIDEHDDEHFAVVALVCETIEECVEPSCSRFYPGVWYTDIDGSVDYCTGERERRSYHLSGFTPDEEQTIYSRLTAR